MSLYYEYALKNQTNLYNLPLLSEEHCFHRDLMRGNNVQHSEQWMKMQ